MKKLKYLLLFLSFVCTEAFALADCAQSTVQAAINAASDGATITCPSGSWSWSGLSINNHNITLQGNGIGNTNISLTAAGAIQAETTNTKAFRITGFTFTSTSNFGTDEGFGAVKIFGGKGWRIDHNQFFIYSDVISYDGGNAIYTIGNSAGLIDNNRFEKGGGSGCMHASVYVSNYIADQSNWALPSGQISQSAFDSTDRTIFIEDNYFYNPDSCSDHNPHAVYGTGGIYVFRHNEIHGMNADSHGLCASQGTREYEISNNTWTGVSGNTLFAIIHPRGGTGVVYNNTWTGSITHGYWVEDYRTPTSPTCSGVTYNLPGFGNVNSSTSCPTTEGYPCAQQIGRGQDNDSDPLYIWNNTGTVNLLNDSPTQIQSGRDYFLDAGAKPGYSAYTYPHPLQDVGPSAPTNFRFAKKK